MEETPKDQPLSDVERIKAQSRFLRGTIKESLADELTGALRGDDQQLIKFHGTYQQQDRWLESERKKQKLEPLYSFMIRVRVPAGICRPEQWLALDQLTDRYAMGTLKLTTRQAFELHTVLKCNLKATIKAINEQALFTTIAACGDVNRNVMATASPSLTRLHTEVHQAAKAISDHLLPKSTAYPELWLDRKIVSGGEVQDEEPVYGKTYLPRKFKISLAIPPVNDTDVFAHDIGLIAIAEKDGTLAGFNVLAGGGMACTFNMPETFPRLGTLLGYIPRSRVVDVCEKIVTIQRDHGNRMNRKQSRLKYTVLKMGVENFRAELEKLLGYPLEPVRPFHFKDNNDVYGWQKGEDGLWDVTLFIEGGRVKDTPDYPMKTGLREIAGIHKGVFILTGNQNLVIAGVDAGMKPKIESLLENYGIAQHQNVSAARKNSLACVSFPLCPLAFAEAETYLPKFMDKLDVMLKELDLLEVPVNLRMTGCPNGCARPFLGEIAMVGRAPGKYNLYLGGTPVGDRLNRLYKEEMLSEEQLLSEINAVLSRFAKERQAKERLGDYLVRAGIIQKT